MFYVRLTAGNRKLHSILNGGIKASTIILTFMNSSVHAKNIREGHTHMDTTVHYVY